jgi:UDP-N-acetylglucosamine acyltransferase
MKIHPLAVVSPLCDLAADVEIGPFAVVEPGTAIGEGCRIASRAVIKTGTRLGPHNHVYEGAVLGGMPQHLRMPEKVGDLVIGARNTFRECVTVHRGMSPDHPTVIGDSNLLMVNVHIAHDCVLGSNIVIANNTLLAGHVTVDDRAYISGAVAAHQFCRIGKFAMVGGQSHVVKDIPPYVTIDGASTLVVGLNLVGLRRNGFTDADILQLKAAYRLIYRSGMPWNEMLKSLAAEYGAGPAAAFCEFFAGGKRGFVQERRMPPNATLRIRHEFQEEERQRRAAAG